MDAFSGLEHEHEYISKVVESLEIFAKKMREGAEIPVGELESAVDFLKVFADRCHHGKEEELLFPELEKHGVSREKGPTAVMLLEHDEGRGFVRDLDEGIQGSKKGYAWAAEQIIASIEGLARILKPHIQKENQVLFKMANQLLTKGEKDDLNKKFGEIEQKVIGPEKYEEYENVANRLQKAASS